MLARPAKERRRVDVAQRTLADMKTLFDAKASQLAAVIVEPLVQCAAGMAMHDPSYLKGLRALCDDYGVHLIADEIESAVVSHGHVLACEQLRSGRIPVFIEGNQRRVFALSIVLHA